MPQKSVTVIYLPGLGGEYDAVRRFALKFWPRRHWDVHFLSMDWTDHAESYEQKKARVHEAISKVGGQVVLIGESAGAAMGLVVAYENKSIKLVTLCGKIGGAKSTGQRYYDRVPAFAELLPYADSIRLNLPNAMKTRIITVRAYNDKFLSLRDTTLPGVKQIVLPSIGHLTTIILGITIFRYGILRAIKELTTR